MIIMLQSSLPGTPMSKRFSVTLPGWQKPHHQVNGCWERSVLRLEVAISWSWTRMRWKAQTFRRWRHCLPGIIPMQIRSWQKEMPWQRPQQMPAGRIRIMVPTPLHFRSLCRVRLIRRNEIFRIEPDKLVYITTAVRLLPLLCLIKEYLPYPVCQPHSRYAVCSAQGWQARLGRYNHIQAEQGSNEKLWCLQFCIEYAMIS